MSEPIDYDRCKTHRPSLYVFTYITYLLALVTALVIIFGVNRKLDEVKSMHPCTPTVKER